MAHNPSARRHLLEVAAQVERQLEDLKQYIEAERTAADLNDVDWTNVAAMNSLRATLANATESFIRKED